MPKMRVFGLLQPVAGDFRSNEVTSGHVRSHDVISGHVAATCCELQPCRSLNLHKTWVLSLPQPLPAEFRSNVNFWVTSSHMRSRDIISCHVTATSCELQPWRSSN